MSPEVRLSALHTPSEPSTSTSVHLFQNDDVSPIRLVFPLDDLGLATFFLAVSASVRCCFHDMTRFEQTRCATSSINMYYTVRVGSSTDVLSDLNTNTDIDVGKPLSKHSPRNRIVCCAACWYRQHVWIALFICRQNCAR